MTRTYFYLEAVRDQKPTALPDAEVWQEKEGWYWSPCRNGWPKGSIEGPYDTREEAIEDARYR